MHIRTDSLPWPVSRKLVRFLEKELTASPLSPASGAVLSFRDQSYSAQTGGFHPVEIAVAPDGSIQYMTDFAYCGSPPYCDLAEEIDFDFSLGLFQHFGREYPIESGRELFRLWQSNFVTYYEMGAYTVSIKSFTEG